jgi:hypothetical protein
VTGCILSGILCRRPDEDGVRHEAEPGRLCCWGAEQHLAAALRDIPVLVDELAGGGYVQRDGFDAKVLFPAGHVRAGELVPHRDPVANVLTSGPVNGRSGAPRVAGSGERSLPIRVDPTDLLAHARPASLAVAVAGLYAADQIGHLAVATELEFWARDWADTRRESVPPPTVPLLAAWLIDRLDWACSTHPALDEFAAKLRDLRGSLTAATGRLEPFPTPVDRPCPACGWWALSKAPGEDLIRCGHCDRALSDDEYRDHLEDVIKTNWNPFDYQDKAGTAPKHDNLVLIREDYYTGGVTMGYFDGYTFRTWAGSDDCSVSYWAEISYPADPGPRKEEAA